MRPRLLLALIALLALLASLLSPSVASAEPDEEEPPSKEVEESATGSYIVVMQADPLVITEGQDNLDSSQAQRRSEELQDSHEEALEEAGVASSRQVHTYVNALNGFSAVLSHEEAQKVAGSKGVAQVIPDEMRHLDTESSPGFLELDEGKGAWASGVTGEGVIVGVIDSGIWPEHPSFADDGSYRAPAGAAPDIPCDFGNTAHNPADVAFTCNNKLIGARQELTTYRALIGADPGEYDSARDDNGHGTHTASTAAGNADVEAEIFGRHIGTVSGIAPRAHIIAYKGLGTLGGFTSDLAGAIDQAVADGVDVINYSVGGGPGLTGPDEIAYLFAADAGVFVATSAGNSGPGAATIGGPGTVPWITTVGANTQPRFFEGELELGNGEEYSGASITNPLEEAPLIDGADVGGDLCIPGTLDATQVEGKVVLCRRGAIGRASKSMAVYQAGGVGMVLYENTDDNNLFTDTHWVPSIHVDNTPGLEVKAYIAASGGSATAEIKAWEVEKWESAPSITHFSSRGPNPVAESIIKPDITAPGFQIVAGHTPTPLGAVQGELFQSIAGTSMSSPHIAGIFALIKQVHPDWTPAMAKSAIMTTAYQKDVVNNDRVSPAGPFDMGAGHVDPGKPSKKGSAFQPGLVYDAGFFEYLGFLCDAEPEALASSTCPFLDSIGVPIRAVDLNMPSIGVAQLAGTETITRTVTSVARGTKTFEVEVKAPRGYDVTVSPSTLTLSEGESASYQVTITNNGGGAVGVWSHGSLEWKGGGYKVRSSISVKATQLDTPADITGSGTTGSASIPVKFGYTGAYSAAAHGLVAESIIADTVLQDPDQNFDPTDGFSNAHPFDLSGAAHFRIAMPPTAVAIPDIDIDIFVADPSGNIVAQSTSGGTDELIELAQPVDGTWTVYVHGWQAAGPSADYELSTWIVPLTTGGSLSVDAAPASAELGVVGSVDVSWAGLTAGTSYLGAVSHHDDAGIQAITLVSVDG